ncbi:hypothetical protein U9M48_032300 [Paspalum notatum var. saurae]|uniref:Uncharacterized protein n=1 Tax=Paspalum notatum var. saurae TaxID=547442 RepID=A0AAQ3X4A8_PASNO
MKRQHCPQPENFYSLCATQIQTSRVHLVGGTREDRMGRSHFRAVWLQKERGQNRPGDGFIPQNWGRCRPLKSSGPHRPPSLKIEPLSSATHLLLLHGIHTGGG